MVFVPVPTPPQRTSPRVQDLGDQLTKVIEDYQRRFPDLSSAEVRQAVQLALQKKGTGQAVSRQALATAVGVAAFLAGVGAFMARRGALSDADIPWMMISIGAVAVIGALVFLFRRGD